MTKLMQHYNTLNTNLRGSFTVQDAMQVTGLKRAQVYRILKALITQRFVVRPGTNKYCIVGDEHG